MSNEILTASNEIFIEAVRTVAENLGIKGLIYSVRGSFISIRHKDMGETTPHTLEFMCIKDIGTTTYSIEIVTSFDITISNLTTTKHKVLNIPADDFRDLVRTAFSLLLVKHGIQCSNENTPENKVSFTKLGQLPTIASDLNKQKTEPSLASFLNDPNAQQENSMVHDIAVEVVRHVLKECGSTGLEVSYVKDEACQEKINVSVDYVGDKDRLIPIKAKICLNWFKGQTIDVSMAESLRFSTTIDGKYCGATKPIHNVGMEVITANLEHLVDRVCSYRADIVAISDIDYLIGLYAGGFTISGITSLEDAKKRRVLLCATAAAFEVKYPLVAATVAKNRAHLK